MINNMITIIEAGSSLLSFIKTLSLLFFIILALCGLIKPAWRFAIALKAKKIYVVSNLDNSQTICDDLVNSGLIKEKNIIKKNSDQIGYLSKAKLLILDFDFLDEEKILKVVESKEPACGVIVYSKCKKITDSTMDKLNESPQVSVVNFRGRLINEVILLLISTSFVKSDIKNQ